MKSIRTKPQQRAVTLTELLVVLAIVSILATLAVPVYVSQMQRARVATAQAEVRTIAEAEQMVAITHGFYVPIHILDNIPNRQNGSSTGGNSSDRDDFENLQGGQRYVIDATRSVEDQVVNSSGTPLDIPLNANGDVRVQRMIEGWQGPFLNPRRVRYENEDPQNPGSGELTIDLVVDPWGNPYRMYTDLGLVGDASLPNNTNEDVFLSMDNGRLTQSAVEQDRFDRFAIVSYGPNGVSGFTNSNPLDQGDDIFYTFSGIAGNETTYQGY